MNILQQIFTDHYEEMIYTLHPRPVVITNVDRMLLCGDHSQGGAMYSCPHCGNMKSNLCDTRVVTKYIGRYLGRPAIALKRIDSYDGDSVTFHYNRHEDNAFIRKTVPVMDFISLLIQHIPDWNFKMVRYYGLYARHRDQDKSLRRAIQKKWHPILKSFNRWRTGISCSFGYDPLKCTECGHQMILVDIYRNHTHIPLEALYERTMLKAKQKARCRSS